MCNSTAGAVLGVIGTAALAYVSMGSSLAVEGGMAAGAATTAADGSLLTVDAVGTAGAAAAAGTAGLASGAAATSALVAGGGAAATGVAGTSALTAGALSMGTTGLSMYAQSQTASANAKAMEAANAVRDQQVEGQAGNADTQAAMQARAARAQSTVAAGAIGVNLGSNSFLGSLQTTTMNEGLQTGITAENERNQIVANTTTTNSDLAQRATSPSPFGALLDSSLSGAGAYMNNSNAYNMGVNTARGIGYSDYE